MITLELFSKWPRRYSVFVKGIGYVGDVFKVGGWKGRDCRGYWVFESTKLRQKIIGNNWRQMNKWLNTQKKWA